MQQLRQNLFQPTFKKCICGISVASGQQNCTDRGKTCAPCDLSLPPQESVTNPGNPQPQEGMLIEHVRRQGDLSHCKKAK